MPIFTIVSINYYHYVNTQFSLCCNVFNKVPTYPPFPSCPALFLFPSTPVLPTIQSDFCRGEREHKAFALWIDWPPVSRDCRIFKVANRKKPRHFIEMPLFCHYLTTLLRFSTWLLRSKAKCLNWAENTFYFFLFLELFKIPRTLQELAVSKSAIYPKSGQLGLLPVHLWWKKWLAASLKIP